MKKEIVLVLTSAFSMAPIALAQQKTYVGTNVTGQFVLVRTVNASNASPTFAASTFGPSARTSARPDYLQRYFSSIDEFAPGSGGLLRQASRAQGSDYAMATLEAVASWGTGAWPRSSHA